MANTIIPPSPATNTQVLIGTKQYKLARTGSDTGNPFGILIFGYRTLLIASSVSFGSPLSQLNTIVNQGVSGDITITDGVITMGTDTNRRFIAIMPEQVYLQDVTT